MKTRLLSFFASLSSDGGARVQLGLITDKNMKQQQLINNKKV